MILVKSVNLFFLLLPFNVGVFAQTSCDCYERLSNLSSYYQKTNNLDSSIWAKQKALSILSIETQNFFDYVQLAEVYATKNKLDSSYKYSKKAVELGYRKSWLLNNAALKPLTESKYKNELNLVNPIANKNFNWEYYDALLELYGIDQSIRRGDQLAPYLDSLTFTKTDAFIFEKIERLIEIHGYPNFKDHGFGDKNLQLFFLHSSMYSEEKLNRILGYLEEANRSCYSKRGMIALIKDRRIAWYDGQPQPAGTFNFADKFAPIADPEMVDSVRFVYNQLTLRDYARVKGVPLPKGYVKQEYPLGYFCDDAKSIR